MQRKRRWKRGKKRERQSQGRMNEKLAFFFEECASKFLNVNFDG
jgi:hypothetical protein